MVITRSLADGSKGLVLVMKLHYVGESLLEGEYKWAALLVC
jgi:hypothetical protein